MKKILFLLLLTTTLYAKEQICSWDYKLVGLFHFNEGSGTAVRNEVDKTAGVITGGAWVNGLFDKGIYQSAAGKWIDCANFKDIGIGGASEATFNIWLYAPIDDWCTVNGWFVDAGVVRNMDCRVCDAFAAYPLTRIAVTWTTGDDTSYYQTDKIMYSKTWYMITIDWKANKDTNIYVNGVMLTSETVTYGGVLSANNQTTTFLNDQGHGNSIFSISDEIAIWRRQLSPSEIMQMYKKGIGKRKCIKLQ